jgi:hypothetical protein
MSEAITLFPLGAFTVRTETALASHLQNTKHCKAASQKLKYGDYLLTARSIVLLEKLVKKFPTFYGIPRFINAVTIVRHLSLS